MRKLYTICFPIDFSRRSFEHAVSQNWTGGSSLTRWIIFSLIVLVGCSKNKGVSSVQETLPELTLEQQADVAKLNKTYLEIQSLAQWGSKDVFRQMDMGFVGPIDAEPNLKDCEFDHYRPGERVSALPTKGYYYSVIDGESCPILLSHRTGYRVSDISGIGHVDVSLEYQALQPKNFNFKSYVILGRLEVKKSQMLTQVFGSLQGEIQTWGSNAIPLEYYVSMKDGGVKSSESTQSVRLKFPEFTVLAEAVRSRRAEKSSEQFKLNGLVVDEAQFERVVGAFLPTQGPFSF